MCGDFSLLSFQCFNFGWQIFQFAPVAFRIAEIDKHRLKCDAALYGKYFREMLIRGVYMAPSAYEAAFMSAAHSEEDLEKTAQAFKDSLNQIL